MTSSSDIGSFEDSRVGIEVQKKIEPAKFYSKQNKSHALSFQNFFPTGETPVRDVAQDIPDERPKAVPPPIFMRSQRHPKAKAHLYGKRLL